MSYLRCNFIKSFEQVTLVTFVDRLKWDLCRVLSSHKNRNKMENQKNIYQLHEEHKTWLNKLLFYKDELSIMANRISEVAKKNTSNEVLALVEKFQNQLIIQKEQRMKQVQMLFGWIVQWEQ